MSKQETIDYYKRIKNFCEKLELQLIGFSPGLGFTYKLRESDLGTEYMSEELMKRIEKQCLNS